MNESEKNLQLLLERIEARERKAKKRGIIFTLVPIVVGIVVLVVIGFQISRLNEAKEVNNELRERVVQEIAAHTFQLNKALSLIGRSNLDSAKSVLDSLTDDLRRLESDLDYVGVKLATSEFNLARQQLTSSEFEADTVKTDAAPGPAESGVKADTTKRITAAPKKTSRTTTSRVYIHLRDKSQLEASKRIAEQLEKQGYVVPKEEILVEKGPSNTEVRYFGKRDQQTANSIAKMLVEEFNVRDTRAKYLGGYEIKPGYFEIWFSPHSLGGVASKR